MPGKTVNYNLIKPTTEEFYDVAVQNGNMDIIDTKLKEVAEKASKITPGDIKFSDGKTVAEKIDNISSQMAETVKYTTADISYYVATTGNDTTGDGTSSKPFKTIQHAIDLLPQTINHKVTINLASGTYNEELKIYGFVGKNAIVINGGNDNSQSINYIIRQIIINTCACNIILNGVSTNINNIAIYCSMSNYVQISNCTVTTVNPNFACILCGYGGTVSIGNSILSNGKCGITAANGATVISDSNSGTGNTIALNASYGGTIVKAGTQPSGATAESVTYGGVIR